MKYYSIYSLWSIDNVFAKLLYYDQLDLGTRMLHLWISAQKWSFDYSTITLPKASDISRLVGASDTSGWVEMPTDSLSSMSFIKTAGTLSSVARMVSRTIYSTN